MSGHPIWCCQKCGAGIGLLGRLWQWLRLPVHRCASIQAPLEPPHEPFPEHRFGQFTRAVVAGEDEDGKHVVSGMLYSHARGPGDREGPVSTNLPAAMPKTIRRVTLQNFDGSGTRRFFGSDIRFAAELGGEDGAVLRAITSRHPLPSTPTVFSLTDLKGQVLLMRAASLLRQAGRAHDESGMRARARELVSLALGHRYVVHVDVRPRDV